MNRSVLILLLLIAAGAGTWLWRQSQQDPKPPSPAVDAPRALTAAEVETYLRVTPLIQAKMSEMTRRMGRVPAAQRKTVGQQGRQEFLALLKRHHLTVDDWNKKRARVEHVVDQVRTEKARPAALAALKDKIKAHENMLDGVLEGETRARMEKDLATWREQLTLAPPPLHDSDRSLAEKHWSRLDKAVPHRGMPRKVTEKDG